MILLKVFVFDSNVFDKIDSY